MERQKLILSLLAVILTVGLLSHISPDTPNSSLASESGSVGCVARSTIISRGQDWVDKHVPYSQSGTHDGYRTDCSGFVSMCWQLSKPGPSTSEFSSVSKSINKADLAPGDAIICEGKHVVLFAGWSDSSKTSYIAM